VTEVCSIDFETRSTVDLKKSGVYRYAEDATTDVWCAAYAFGDGPVESWVPTGDWPDCPPAIVEHVAAGGQFVAWNANFERILWREVLAPRYGWPVPKLRQWSCSMAQALAMSLPGGLDACGQAVGLADGKDMDGHRLMMRMCRPRRVEGGSIVWWTDAEKVERLRRYCEADVRTEREIRKRLVPLRPQEQRLWWLDQKINDRGVQVDVELCEKAIVVVQQQQDKLNREMRQATEGVVTACSQISALAEWVRSHGVEVDSLAKDKLDELLAEQSLPENVECALELRREANKASTSKIAALLNGRSRGGRANGLLQFHAASTGRWAGRRFQPQNLKRPDETTNIDQAIEAILTGASAATIERLFGPPLSIIGDCLRGMVCAANGQRLVFGDFVSIEAVVLAWLASEKWKLTAFKDYRAGKAPDLYIQAYCKAFGVPVFGKKDKRRQIGKVMELASGYQGGHGAYLKMGMKGERLKTLVELVQANADDGEWMWAEDAYHGAVKAGRGYGLTPSEWTALRVTIDRWRAAHSRIANYWLELEGCVLSAVENPGATLIAGGRAGQPSIKYRMAGSFLWCQLPSGRCLCYPYPRIEMKDVWGGKKPTVIYKGVDSYTRKWGDSALYGGLLAENVTQAVARDLLAEAMLRLEERGYPVVLHVHDEAGAEVPVGFGSVEEYEAIMSEVPAWAAGCPVATDAWEGLRYRK
jgi:DNA polymerase